MGIPTRVSRGWEDPSPGCPPHRPSCRVGKVLGSPMPSEGGRSDISWKWASERSKGSPKKPATLGQLVTPNDQPSSVEGVITPLPLLIWDLFGETDDVTIHIQRENLWSGGPCLPLQAPLGGTGPAGPALRLSQTTDQNFPQETWWVRGLKPSLTKTSPRGGGDTLSKPYTTLKHHHCTPALSPPGGTVGLVPILPTGVCRGPSDPAQLQGAPQSWLAPPTFTQMGGGRSPTFGCSRGAKGAEHSQGATLPMPGGGRAEGRPRGCQEGSGRGGNDTAPGERLNDAGAGGCRTNVTEEG